jgi:hypothetical protein
VPDPAVQYPWYQIVEGASLEQGDILSAFDVLVPCVSFEAGVDNYSADLKTFDVVVMTQSCDIEQGKTPSLLLCPLFGLWDFVEAAKARNENWGNEVREKLRQGNLPGYHLLDDCSLDGIERPLTVVDFHEVYSAPTVLVRKFAESCGRRLRLCPPYKEHLGQAFARFFMRVGLPVGISKDKLKTKP